jgi:hypothetical protein
MHPLIQYFCLVLRRLDDHFFNLRHKFLILICDFLICNVQVRTKFSQAFRLYHYKTDKAPDIFPKY